MTKFDTDSIAELEIGGPIAVRFPVRIFTADKSLEMRLHRSQFLKAMGDEYDRLAEILRIKLNEIDPITERPPIAKQAYLDLTAIDAAMREDPED
jgi:hypothetical protein